MKRWLAGILPRRIGGQILLLVVVAVLATQALNVAILMNSNADRREEAQLRAAFGTFLSAVRMMNAAGPEAWSTIAGIVRQTAPNIHFRYTPAGPWPRSPGEPPRGPLAFLSHELGPDVAVRSEAPADANPQSDLRHVSVRLGNGLVISADLRLPSPGPKPLIPALDFLVFALIFVPLLLLWVARHLSGQLRNFARAAEEFSLEGGRDLPETGPLEIQQAARAFNRMRERISRLIADRTRMLSAISHDLRTPITRLRLRAEFIEDDKMRSEIVRDLDRMKRMVNSALTFIRDGRDAEARTAVDLPALTRTIIDNFHDVGEAVRYEGLNHLTISAQPDALVRAIENLVENGLKFGRRVVVRIARAGGAVVIEVEDDGRGIPEAQREAMLEPFVRGDAARNDGSGFGLGLSITMAIVEAHAGRLELTSGTMGGLLARIVLPVDRATMPLAAE